MFIPKTIKNLVILLQVPISNVMDGFWRFLFILMLISCALISPGSAEAYVG